MREEVFIETNNAQNIANGLVDNIVYPRVLTHLVSFIQNTGLRISMLRFGADGIELSTAPDNETAYIEYSIYFDQKKYRERKLKYQAYLDLHKASKKPTQSEFAFDYVLNNRHQVMLYANDMERILIYKDAPQILDSSHKYYLTDVFLVLIRASMTQDEMQSPFVENALKTKSALPMWASAKAESPSRIRYDGIYITAINNDCEYASYLRFFPTGMVTGCVGGGDCADKIFQWLDEESPFHGSYSIEEDKIELHITGIGFEGTSKLIGTIVENGIILQEDKPSWNNAAWDSKPDQRAYEFREM